MIKACHKAPCARPGESLQVKVADVVEDTIVLAGDASHDEELVVVEDACMSSSASRDWSILSWLSPMCRLQVENDQIGKVCAMLVFSAKDKKFVSLIKIRRVAFYRVS